MQNRYDTRPGGDDGPPTWRPQPGKVLAGVIDHYSISDTPQSLVRTVIVTEARTSMQVSLRLTSTNLLTLFAKHHPHTGEWIEVRYRVDRPVPLELSRWGGKCPMRHPGTRNRAAIAIAGLM